MKNDKQIDKNNCTIARWACVYKEWNFEKSKAQRWQVRDELDLRFKLQITLM